MPVVSARVRAADEASSAVRDFYFNSRYGERRTDPNICDFTFGNPHEFPLDGLVRGDPGARNASEQGLVRLQDQRA